MNPEQALPQARARLAISQAYKTVVDQDPDHQDQLDKNRVPGSIEIGEKPLLDEPDAADEEE